MRRFKLIRQVTGPTRTARPAPRRRATPRNRPTSRPGRYYLAAGIDLRAETERLCRLEALGGDEGPLVKRPPELTVRRASKRPRSRMGFAIPEQHRLSVTVYPGIKRGDLEETLLHELVHLAVGASPGGRRWHGREFTETLRKAMAEAWGVRGVKPSNTYHGAYAEALEKVHARDASLAAQGVHPDQLELSA